MKLELKNSIDVTQLSTRYIFDMFGEGRGMSLLDSASLLQPGGRAPLRVSKLNYWTLCVDSINRYNDEGHACLNRRLPKSTWSLIFNAVSQEETLGIGLKRMAELLPLIGTGLRGKVSYCSKYVHFTLMASNDLRPSPRVERYIDLISTVFLCVLNWGAGQQILPSKIRMSSILDPDDGFCLAGLSTLTTEIGGRGKTLSFDIDDLNLPLRARAYDDWGVPETLMFKQLCSGLIKGASNIDGSLIASVRKILEGNAIDQNGVALELGYSTSTLQRKLALLGTTFREIVRELRKSEFELLIRTSASVEDIAYLMCFSDRRSLTRACQDWFGVTPSAYRKLYESGLNPSH